jgi:HEAT repeat protein
LTKALRDPNRTVRFVACVALAKLGEEAKQAVPHLLNALEDPDREVRHLAIYAVRSLDPEAAAKAGVK